MTSDTFWDLLAGWGSQKDMFSEASKLLSSSDARTLGNNGLCDGGAGDVSTSSWDLRTEALFPTYGKGV